MNLITVIVLDFVSLSEVGYKLFFLPVGVGESFVFFRLQSRAGSCVSVSWIFKAWGQGKHIFSLVNINIQSVSHVTISKTYKDTNTIYSIYEI